MADQDFAEIDAAVNRLIGGDDSARQLLIQISCERLKRLTRKMLNDFPVVRRWEETDDVFQKMAVRLWQSLEKVQPTDSRHFFNLAALQIRRELIEVARSLSGPLGIAKNQESVGAENTDSLRDTGNAASETYEPGRLAAWSEFHEGVEQLDDDEKEVFALIWYQGLSQEDVAKLLNISQKTVSRRWQKARRHLHASLRNISG